MNLVVQLIQHQFNVAHADGSLDDSDVSGSRMKKEMGGCYDNGTAWVVRALQQ